MDNVFLEKVLKYLFTTLKYKVVISVNTLNSDIQVSSFLIRD